MRFPDSLDTKYAKHTKHRWEDLECGSLLSRCADNTPPKSGSKLPHAKFKEGRVSIWA